MRQGTHAARCVAAGLACLALAGCGGSDTPAPQSSGGNQQPWVAGQFLPAETFEARCAAPRTDLDPISGLPLFDDIQGSVVDENNWLRSWTHDLYLWFDEVPDIDPASQSNTLAYFSELRTSALTASGNPKDRFHFSRDTAQWQAESQSGIRSGYGMEITIIRPTPPRVIVVAYTQPDSPAALAGITRGYRIVGVDGADAVQGNTQAIVDVLNAGLFPRQAGESHAIEVLAPSGGPTQTIELTSAAVTTTPVQHVGTVTSPQGATVGYMHFSDHIAPAEAQLLEAVEFLATQNIEDLVIDLRYNGGGFLALAAQLAYMVAGEAQTAGRTFETLQFNSQHPTTNPVTGTPLSPLPFLGITIGLADAPANQALPTLNLDRVFVITGPGTCSASESIINSLRGIGVEVVQIGSRTCGKPYGFYPTDNCGTTYFSIQFRGINDAGFGDYADGFSPPGGGAPADAELPGCSVPDDFDRLLGDPAETRLAAALQYRDSATCPLITQTSTQSAQPADATLRAAEESLKQTPGLSLQEKSPWRTNRILSPF